MTPAYLDHDAKAYQANYEAAITDQQAKQARNTTAAFATRNQPPQQLHYRTLPIHLPRSSLPHSSYYHKTPRLHRTPCTSHPLYIDHHLLLLILQLFTVAAFSLFLLDALSNFLGITSFLRSRLFLI
ncbi:hypothetical protein BCR34DRAFT_602170 [Clohesyomyces aquaticus]|uniref:Uncharacterized protein n=1 Tax=Clohesyomyces aquaticus TaxID=1231657 RepID=A0A1Y1ZJF9_9PLEO|nr:hypothetical protein BCR34DRAFT_602170 [Clohesyomyces aquaticus]